MGLARGEFGEIDELELLKHSEKDSNWLLRNYEKIREKHENKFVAVKDNEIIADGEDIKEIEDKLKKQNVDPKTTIVDFIPPKDFVLFL